MGTMAAAAAAVAAVAAAVALPPPPPGENINIPFQLSSPGLTQTINHVWFTVSLY